MSTIRKLISAWMLALVGSLLLPLVGIAAISGTTYDAPSATTTTPATIAEHASVTDNYWSSSVGLRSNQSWAPLSLSRGSVAPKKGTDVYRVVEKAELDDIERTGAFRFREGSSTPEPGLKGKWFYESLDDADVGASRIMRPSERAATVKVTVPEEALKHPFPNVDGVQRVQFIEMDDLRGLPIRRVD